MRKPKISVGFSGAQMTGASIRPNPMMRRSHVPTGSRPMVPMGPMRPMGPMGPMRPMGPMGPMGPNLMGDLTKALNRRSMKVPALLPVAVSTVNKKEENGEKDVIDTSTTTKAEKDSPIITKTMKVPTVSPVNMKEEGGDKDIDTSTTSKPGKDSPKTKQKGLFSGLFGKSKRAKK